MRKLELFNSVKYPRSVIISGACRSGKTTLCKLWASMQGVEWVEEPISLSLITQCADMYMDSDGLNGISPELFGQLWGLEFKEIANDIILCRSGVNFRPDDLSSAWGFKQPKELIDRLLHIHTREEVRGYIEEHDPVFLIDIPELILALSSLNKATFGHKLFYIVRSPEDVALETVNKNWFSDENLINPLQANDCSYLYEYSGKNYRLPFLVKEDDAKVFIESSEYVRGLMYWISIAESGIECMDSVDLMLKYEDIISDPNRLVSELEDMGYGKITEKTKAICEDIKNRSKNSSDDMIKHDKNIPEDIMKRYNTCREYYGY